jgi:hypothetical protein
VRGARWPHLVAGLYVSGMVVLSAVASDAYYRLVQEDGLVEWSTVGLFAVAGAVRLRAAWRDRQPFDGLVGLFCVFVAGEEIAWGQRLLGFTPPEYFLEANFQQETTLHNFADVFGRPGPILAVLAVCYGLVLPLAARSRWMRGLLDRTGATPPGPGAAPWFGLAAVLLVAYPVQFTGEWVEAMAGALFLATSSTAPGPWLTAIALGGLMTGVSLASRDPGGARSACAGAEAEALLRDLVEGRAATARLAAMARVHKRVYSAMEAGYIDPSGIDRLGAVACNGGKRGDARDRRRYGIDPWGMSYWLLTDAGGSTVRVAVYSVGPNRRRDGEPGTAAGDDIVVYADLGGEPGSGSP